MADAALHWSLLHFLIHVITDLQTTYYEWDCFSYLPTNMILNVSGDEGHSDIRRLMFYDFRNIVMNQNILVGTLLLI